MKALEVRKKSKLYCVQLQAQHGSEAGTVYGKKPCIKSVTLSNRY